MSALATRDDLVAIPRPKLKIARHGDRVLACLTVQIEPGVKLAFAAAVDTRAIQAAMAGAPPEIGGFFDDVAHVVTAPVRAVSSVAKKVAKAVKSIGDVAEDIVKNPIFQVAAPQVLNLVAPGSGVAVAAAIQAAKAGIALTAKQKRLVEGAAKILRKAPKSATKVIEAAARKAKAKKPAATKAAKLAATTKALALASQALRALPHGDLLAPAFDETRRTLGVMVKARGGDPTAKRALLLIAQRAKAGHPATQAGQIMASRVYELTGL